MYLTRADITVAGIRIFSWLTLAFRSEVGKAAIGKHEIILTNSLQFFLHVDVYKHRLAF